jgi:hypothetical protein
MPSIAKQKAISSAYVGNSKGLGGLGKNVGLQKKGRCCEEIRISHLQNESRNKK